MLWLKVGRTKERCDGDKMFAGLGVQTAQHVSLDLKEQQASLTHMDQKGPPG